MATPSNLVAHQDQQKYDSLLKRIIHSQIHVLLLLFFPELFAVLQSPEIIQLDIELLKPPKRPDRVYLLRNSNYWIILHLEIEISPDSRFMLNIRMAGYGVYLFERYHEEFSKKKWPGYVKEKLSVFSSVLYPFRKPGEAACFVNQGPLGIRGKMEYDDLSFFEMDARAVFEAKSIPLYCFTPVMENIDVPGLFKAIDAMLYYYQEDRELKEDVVLCFQLFLEKTKHITEAEKVQVIERMHMIDPMVAESPWVQSIVRKEVVKAKAEAEAEGEAKGEAKAMRQSIITIINLWYPQLLSLTNQQIKKVVDTGELARLHVTLLSIGQHHQRKVEKLLREL